MDHQVTTTANRIIADRSSFLAAARTVAAIAPANAFRNVLSAVVIRGTDSGILLDHDGECSIETPAIDEPHEWEDVAVEATPLVEAILAMDANFAMEANAKALVLSTVRRRVEVPLLLFSDVPVGSWDEFKDAPVTIPAPWLASIIAACIAVVKDAESTRYSIKGMYMEHRDGVLRAVATDGRRLVMDTKHSTSSAKDAKAIVPHAAMSHLARLLKGVDGDVAITFGGSCVRFEIGATTYITRHLEGTFPPYSDVVPKDAKIVGICSSSEWCDSLRAVVASARTEKEQRAVDVEFESEAQIVLSSADGGGRAARAAVDAESVATGNSMSLRIQYAMDAGEACGGMMEIRSDAVGTERFGKKPLVFVAGSRTTVVMPCAKE